MHPLLSVDETITALGLRDAAELRRLVFAGKVPRPQKVIGFDPTEIARLSLEKEETKNAN